MTEDGSSLQQDVGDSHPVEVLQAGLSEHDTLKYHLLGPSLTKAGQDSVDQQKVAIVKLDHSQVFWPAKTWGRFQR